MTVTTLTKDSQNSDSAKSRVELMFKPKIMAAKYATVSQDNDWPDGLNVRIHTAMGGKIVSFNRYDRKTDRSNNTVYVIPEDHDFERELGKLITLESMRG